MSKQTMPGSTSSSSTRPTSSMATFFPDRVKSRHTSSQTNGHGHRANSIHYSSPPKANGHSSTFESLDQTNPDKNRDLRKDSSSEKSLTPSSHRDQKPLANGDLETRPKYRSYQVTYDPELSKSKSKGNRAIIRYDGADTSSPTDPRCEGQKRYTRTSKGKKSLAITLPVPKFPVSLIPNFQCLFR